MNSVLFQFSISFLCLLVFIGILWDFLRRRNTAVWALHPFSYFTYAIIFMGPLRGLLMLFDYGQDIGASPGYRVLAVVYTTLFYLVTYLALRLFEARWAPVESSIVVGPKPNTPMIPDIFQCRILFICGLLICLGAFLFIMTSAGFGRLGVNRNLSQGPFLSLCFLILILRWFFLGLGLVLWRQTRNVLYLFLALSILFTFVLQALMSGGRASLVLVGFMLIIIVTREGLKLRHALIGITAGASLTFLLLIMTYLRLELNLYHKDVDAEQIVEEASVAKDEMKYVFAETLEAGFDRKSYHGDALAVLMERRHDGTAQPRGIYAFGSLPDISYIIPQFITHRFFHIGFERHMGLTILGRNVKYPVGPMGEAYYMLGFFGLLIGGFYGWLMAFEYKKLFAEASSGIKIGLHFLLIFMIFLEGSSAIMNSVVLVMKALAIMTPLFAFLYIWFRKRNIRPVCYPRNFGKLSAYARGLSNAKH